MKSVLTKRLVNKVFWYFSIKNVFFFSSIFFKPIFNNYIFKVIVNGDVLPPSLTHSVIPVFDVCKTMAGIRGIAEFGNYDKRTLIITKQL